MSEVAKAGAAKWGQLSAGDKKPYEDAAAVKKVCAPYFSACLGRGASVFFFFLWMFQSIRITAHSCRPTERSYLTWRRLYCCCLSHC